MVHPVGGMREGRRQSTSGSGYFAGAVNTDARNSVFTHVTGNQIITEAKEAPDVERILARLRPADRWEYYVPQCMKGTREDIFNKIDQWLENFNAPNILWLNGNPGAGKSTIASTLISRLSTRSRPCSSFFFRRGDVKLSDPAALWPTIAHHLAEFNPRFADVLVPDLMKNKVDLTRPDIDLLFRSLIQGPLLQSYGKSSAPAVPVIVIDALDECGSSNFHDTQRKALPDTFVQWSRLPSFFKLLITGRDERVPESFRAACEKIVLSTGDEVSDEANDDIRRFFNERFADLGGSSIPAWPGESIISALTKRAAGLFIWAETLIRFVEQGLPDEQLELALTEGLGDEDNITALYRQILERSFRDVKGRTLEVYRLVVSIIILVKVPLRSDDLHELVSLPKMSVKFILDKLSSVISIGTQDKHLRMGHLSFSEFLCDPRRCPEPFLIRREKASQEFALICLQQMKVRLKFNICDLETSYLRNDEVEDLQERIGQNIPAPLKYSCRFWTAHLKDTTLNEDGHGIVMSLGEEISAANVALLTVASWIKDSDPYISAFARDASRFIINFDIPISTSVPHIYLSALPFSPVQSLVAMQYRPKFPNTFSVLSGQDLHWPPAVNILRGHSDTVRCVAFSPDCKWVVSGSDDETIRIWDAETGQIVVGPCEGHNDAIDVVAFSPDCKRVVSRSKGGTIAILDAETGQIVVCLYGTRADNINAVAFSPDCKWFVSGLDKMIYIWDLETGEIAVDPCEGHTDVINVVAFSPDCKCVVSGSRDMTIRIWDAETGQIVAGPFEDHTFQVLTVAFSSNCKQVISGSTGGGVRIWDIEMGEMCKMCKGPFEDWNCEVSAVAFSPDWKLIMSDSLCIWDAETGQMTTGPLEGHTGRICSAAFSPDCKQVVSGSEDETIRIWDAETGQSIASPIAGHVDCIYSVAFSPDGKWVASGSGDKTICIWDTGTGEIIAGPFEGHTDNVYSISFSSDGKRVVSGSSDTTICIWEIETGEILAGPIAGHVDCIYSVAFSADGKRVVSGSGDRTIRIWHVETGQIVAGPFRGHTRDVLSVAFSPDGKRVVSGSGDRTVRIWNIETGQIIGGPFEDHTGDVSSVAFSPDGERVVSGTGGGTIYIRDTESGQMVAGPFEGLGDDVYSLMFSPDGGKVLLCSCDETICIWDTLTGQTTAGAITGHIDLVCSVAFSPDGKRVASGSHDRTIRIWDAQKCKTITGPMGSQVRLANTDAFLRNDNRVASRSAGNSVRSGEKDNSSSSRNKRTEILVTTGFTRIPILWHDPAPGPSLLYSNLEPENGWILLPSPFRSKGFPMLWVPPQYLEGLCDERTLLTCGRRTVRADFSRFVHGESWIQCRSPLTDAG